MSFYRTGGSADGGSITPLTVTQSGRSYYEVGTAGLKATYTFQKAYTEAIVIFTKTNLGGDISFTNCDHEKISKSTSLRRGSVELYRLTNVKPGSLISAYSYANSIEENTAVDSLFAVFVKE